MTAISSGIAKLATAFKPAATMTEHLGHLSRARTLFDDVSLKALQGAPRADVSGGWRALAGTVKEAIATNPGIQGYRGLTLDKGLAAAKRLEVGMPRQRDLNTLHAAIGNAKANAVRSQLATKIEAKAGAAVANPAATAKVSAADLARGNAATANIRQAENLGGLAPGSRFGAIDKYIANSKPVQVHDFGVAAKPQVAVPAGGFDKAQIVQLRGLNADQAARIPSEARFFSV